MPSQLPELPESSAKKIRTLCDDLAARFRLDDATRNELGGHLEDKLAGYLSGEVRISEEDALTLVRAHFGILHETGSDFIPVMLYDWRSLPPQHRRRIVELKDHYDAIWQESIDALHAEGRLAADARIARLMILGAINYSATWYRARPRGRRGVDLDTLAAETSALFLREAPR